MKFKLVETGVGAMPAEYASWEHYLEQTTEAERRRWCARKAKTANRKRLEAVDVKLTAADIWTVLENARGRCEYCGSLALQERPSGADGRPLPWEPVGRRIGSLDHRIARVLSGSNGTANLAWACLWCNTWPHLRQWGASDHGALHDPQP
jgi:hypothetical protein